MDKILILTETIVDSYQSFQLVALTEKWVWHTSDSVMREIQVAQLSHVPAFVWKATDVVAGHDVEEFYHKS